MSLSGLWWASAVEGLVILVAILLLIVLRRRIAARRREVEQAVLALEPVMHRWLVADGAIEPVVSTLRTFHPYAALRSLARFSTLHVPQERHEALAHAFRYESWVEAVLRSGASCLWWRRFDAARLLCIVGQDDDAERIGALLDDPNPAVRLVAIDAAARLARRPLVERELDSLPRRQDPVQAYHFAALARHPSRVAEALEMRLNADTPMGPLIAWIAAAAALAIPSTLRRVRDLATHPRAEVRLHVARALRRLADPETPTVLLALLRDADWRVRAQAARALGALRCGVAISDLAEAVSDPAWWVRYRSALALAQIGGPARTSLESITRGNDRMARDMSQLVAGLSAAAVIEMSEV